MIHISQSYQGEEVATVEMPAQNFYNLITGKLVVGSALFTATGPTSFNMLVTEYIREGEIVARHELKEYQIEVSCDYDEDQEQFDKTLALIGCGKNYKEEVVV